MCRKVYFYFPDDTHAILIEKRFWQKQKSFNFKLETFKSSLKKKLWNYLKKSEHKRKPTLIHKTPLPTFNETQIAFEVEIVDVRSIGGCAMTKDRSTTVRVLLDTKIVLIYVAE